MANQVAGSAGSHVADVAIGDGGTFGALAHVDYPIFHAGLTTAAPLNSGGFATAAVAAEPATSAPAQVALAAPANPAHETSGPITEASVGAGGATAAQVRQALDESGLNVNGTGIKVGVLSDSFNDLGGAAADEADGALPSASNIQVLKDLGSGGADEGRAMMQIVHDIAPGASLAFYTAFESEQDFANGILALAAAGCKVICDDVSYFDEPFFQNGVVAQAIKTVEAEGVTYVTAAGNNASNGYQAAWTPISGSFDGTILTDTESFGGSLVQTVTINTEGTGDQVPLILQWNQPYGAATSDLEVVVFHNEILYGEFSNRTAGQELNNPLVDVSLPSGTYQIAIENLSGPDPGLIKEITAGDGFPATISGANAGTVVGHAMTPGAITAGAVSAADTPAFGFNPASESFSSSGAGAELLFADNGTPLSSPDALNPVAVSGITMSEYKARSRTPAAMMWPGRSRRRRVHGVEHRQQRQLSPIASPACLGNSTALEALETTFHQDLNGDGTIGVPGTFSLQYKGFDYVAFYNGAYENSDSLPSLAQTGANSIEATLDYGIDVATSQVVADPNYTDSLTALGNTIAQAESLGLSVMVRPLIDFLDPTEIAPYSVGDWRQNYQPTNVAAFFASYQQMIVQEAQVAQANGAQMLSIGAELDQLTGPQYLSYWTDIITAVRQVFSGALTYSASWNTASEVSFWSQLNYEGIDNYVPLSNAPNPTLQDLVNGWLQPATASSNPGAYAEIGNQSPIAYFENLAAQSGKPLLFTELGYANDSGAAADPSASGTSPDPTLQAELYQAFFQAWTQSKTSFLAGMYFWEWDPNGSPSNVGPNIDSFSPQNNPALNQAIAGFEALSVPAGTHLTLSDAIGAEGSTTIGTGASLELAAADSGSVKFGGPTGVLILDHSSTFGGKIFNFTGNGSLSGSDKIDLRDIGFGPGTTVAYTGTSTGGMLTVSDAQHHTANVELAGNYTGSTFSLSSDGSGGTIVIDPAAKQDLARGTLSFSDPDPTAHRERHCLAAEWRCGLCRELHRRCCNDSQRSRLRRLAFQFRFQPWCRPP